MLIAKTYGFLRNWSPEKRGFPGSQSTYSVASVIRFIKPALGEYEVRRISAPESFYDSALRIFLNFRLN